MSLDSGNGVNDTGTEDAKDTRLGEGPNGSVVIHFPRCNPGSVPSLFSTLSTSDDKTRTILEKAACVSLYDDGAPRPRTCASIRLLDEAVATGHSDALVLKAIVERRNTLKHFFEAESKGCTHPLLVFTLGDYFYGRGQYDIAYEYLNKAIMGK